MTKEEAIKRIKDWNLDDDTMEVLTAAIPELKESEDERIRKHIIEILSSLSPCHFDGNEKSECIAWLKKQGEQRPADKVESKFDEDESIRKDIIAYMRYERKSTEEEIENRFIPWIEKQGEKFTSGTFVNVDDVREEFMREVYRVLDADSTNDRANQIIDAFDSLPTTVIVKQDEKTKPYSGISFEYNGHIWGMCARDNGVDILLDKQLFKHLEKQGEQKSADTPKFKVGDWIINSIGMLRHIVAVDKTGYETDKGWLTHDYYENCFHLWAIKDAKDGDVLCIHSSDSDCVFLYKNTVEIESGRNAAVAYCGIDVYANRIEFGIQGPDCIDVRKIKPATKEQRDLLFQKMKEAGYEWNTEDKVLKKIEPKSVWSEEDEMMLECVLDKIGDLGTGEMCKDWLKSIKEKYTWKPSKEQIMALRWVLNHIPYDSHKEEINGLLEQLIKLY